MRFFDLIPPQYRLVAVSMLLVMLAVGSAALAWTAQGWRYGQQWER
ncbi:hypothetical protein ATH90_3931 [Pseudomonas lurida]|jgi:uncharacterized membrane protein YqjE|nr:hypothetical protein ATH90_3931 [Pseudomonas lurida]